MAHGAGLGREAARFDQHVVVLEVEMLLILVEVGVLVHVVCDVRLVAEHELVEGLVALVHILGEHVSHEPETRTGKHMFRGMNRGARGRASTFRGAGWGVRARRGCVAHPLIWARLLVGKSLTAKNSLGTTMLWPTGSNVSGILLSGVKLSCSSVME